VVTDRPGRGHKRLGHGRHAMEERYSLKQDNAKHFAARICAYLEHARRQHRFQSLVLVAADEFVGVLHARMSPQLKQCIGGEIHKNISDLPEQSLRKLIPLRPRWSAKA
jgi:protein required for attachment to host cells